MQALPDPHVVEGRLGDIHEAERHLGSNARGVAFRRVGPLARRPHVRENTHMTNRERPDELEARAIAQPGLGVPLEHADRDGDVDYRFTRPDGRRGALEVTTVTDPKNKIARDQWRKASPEYGPAPALRECWQVWINDRDVRYDGLLARLEPAIAALEEVGRRFERGRLHEFIGSPKPEQDAARTLAQEKVIQALPFPELCRAERHEAPHRIDLVRESHWSASGSNAALELIEAELNAKPDNFSKLRGVAEKYLFAWVDGDTDLAVARPFRGGSAVEWEHFGLPSREPALLEPIDGLWIVDRATFAGWVWTQTTGWRSLGPAAG